MLSGLLTMFGPADQGSVDFSTLGKPSRPNTALIAPEGYVTGRRLTAVAPIFPASPDALRSAFEAVALAEPRTEQVHRDPTGFHDRYLQRTTVGFPDTIDVKVIDLGAGTATVALFSRSQVGYRDFGVNKARLERWIAAVDLKISTGK